jgi:pimeloyl-ACP methyl ester carboxylesterase
MIAQGRGQDLVLEDKVMIAGLRAAAAGITFAAGAIAPAAAISQEGRRVDPNASYVFFLHGRGVERGSSGRRYGHFQFDQIVASLQRSGRIVIAPRRDAGNIDAFASQLAGDVRRLLAAGVSPRRIAIVGFSRGGHIALAASAQLSNPNVSYVILAGCTDRGFSNRMARRPYATSGRVLSLIDRADDSSSPCAPYLARHRGVFSERVFNTGRGHGLFYSPDPTWVAPTSSWLP